MFVAYLRTFARMGLKAIPMRADTGPIGGDLSHEFIVLAPTGESPVFCHAAFEEIDCASNAAGESDYDAPTCSGSSKMTSLYAATDEKHDKAAFGKIRRSGGAGQRHRGRPHLLLRHQVFRSR